MMRSSMFSLSLVTLFFFSISSFALNVPEVELLPLDKHGKKTSFQKRKEQMNDGFGGLDLQNFGTFLWGASASSTMMIANLTLDFEQDYEAIIDMDDFAGLVKSIDCTAPDLHLEFKDEKSFGYAHQVWDWVNHDDNYTFILVASAQACEPESRRQPFLVSHLDFDEVQNKVLMKAVLKTWDDIAVTYKFTIRNEPLPPDALTERDGKSLSLAHDFSRRLFDVSAKGLDIGVSCSPCGIEGSVNVDFDLETKWKVPVGASMKITPQSIAAAVELSLHLGGELTSAWSPGDVNVVSVPLVGFNVGGFFKLGAFLTVDMGFEVGAWTGTAQASMGARMYIPNTSSMQVNLFGDGDNAISGWVPVFEKIPASVSAKVEGSAEAYAQAGIEISANGLGKGFAVSLDMKMPYIQADFSAMADSKGVCGTKKTLGVDVHADIGAELYASASLNDNPPFWTYPLFDTTLGTLIDKCYAFGPENAGATGGGGGSPPPKTSKKKKTKTKKTTSKKTSAHPKTSAPEETLKPVTPTSKKYRTSRTSAKPSKMETTKSPKSTKSPEPTDGSTITSIETKSLSKHTSNIESSRSASDNPSISLLSTTEVSNTASSDSFSRSDTASTDVQSSSSSASFSSSTLTSSGPPFTNRSTTHPATSRPDSGTPTTDAAASSDDDASTTITPGPSITSDTSISPSSFITSTITADDGDSCELDIDSPSGVVRRAPCAPDTLHVSLITKSSSALKTHTETCSVRKAGQACYNYYSAIVNNPARSWGTFTCSDAQERHDGYATAQWESEHPKNEWRDYLPKTMTGADGRVKCQRDEYPPAYFMPSDTTSNRQNKNPQIVRWLPEADNNQGGKIWQGFCLYKDGGKGNGQMKTRKPKSQPSFEYINTKLVDLQSNPSEKEEKGADGKTTTTTYYEAMYTRAVFELAFDWAGQPEPGPANDWYLSENPCWPKAIATDDPGYNLLTDDLWYTTAGSPDQQSSRAAQKSLYENSPPPAYVTVAIMPARRARRGHFSGERKLEILGDGFGVRNANVSRRLADGEVEVIDCASKDCRNERRMLAGDEIAAFIPAVVERKDAIPNRNDEVVATAIAEKRGSAPTDKRLDMSPGLPAATAR